MLLSRNKIDIIGASTSLLCLVHCIVTPFIFLAVAVDSFNIYAWNKINLIFLGVSLLMVYWSSSKTSVSWIKIMLPICFAALLFTVLNESIGWFHIPEIINYIPSLVLFFLHLYNRKQCKCQDNTSCSTPNN